MAYYSKYVKTDGSGKIPVPQVYNAETDEFEPHEGKNGAAFVQSKVVGHTFHHQATAPGEGAYLDVGSAKTLTLEITGSSSARKVTFSGSSIAGTFMSVQGVRLNDFKVASETTTHYEVWQFDITGLKQFRARIAEVSGGNCSVKGMVVY